MHTKCEVTIKGEKVEGEFVGFFQHSRIIDPSPMLHGHSGGTIAHPIALVCVDEAIKEVRPKDIKFLKEETYVDMAAVCDGYIDNLEDENVITANLLDPVESDIIFYIEDKEILKLASDGNIFVHGQTVENNRDVVDALRSFLRSQGYSI